MALAKISTELIGRLKKGQIGVLPTDTLYGLVGSALMPSVVERIYRVRRRDPKKPMIVLVSSVAALALFGVRLTSAQKKQLARLWPGRVSVIVSCPLKKYAYLHRGTGTIAFRVPASEWLRVFLKRSGPLVAPSANPEGREPARSIKQARDYFGHTVDFYRGGRVKKKASTVIDLTDANFSIKRK